MSLTIRGNWKIKSSHSKISSPAPLDSCIDAVRDMLPAMDSVLARHASTRLIDYVEQLGRRRTPGFQCGRDFVDEVAGYTAETLGPELGAAIAEDLAETPQVLTANHHGIDSFAQSTQSNLLFSLRGRKGGRPATTIPVLACGSVPLNNLTFPRGLLIYACADAIGAGEVCKLPIFPDSQKRRLVSVAQAYTPEMLERARSRAERMIEQNKLIAAIGPALERVFDELDGIGQAFPGYARQATVVNNRLWRQLFRGRFQHSELVYIELESIAGRLLQKDLFDPSTICHQLIFDPALRARLIARLDGQRGCWQAQKLAAASGAEDRGRSDAALGTMFFWGVDAKGRRVPLRVVERGKTKPPELRGIDDSGGEWAMPLTAEDVCRGLREAYLLPSVFTSYLAISIARGINCVGGYYQAEYLPQMQQGVIETLSSDAGAAGLNRDRVADDYLSGMQAVGFSAGDRLLPAGPLEIIASGGFDEVLYERIGEVSVMQSHIASLFDIITDIAPRDGILSRSRDEISSLVQDRVGDEIVTVSLD